MTSNNPAPPAATIHPSDLAGVRHWFQNLTTQVNSFDYAGARTQVSPDFIAFGTFADLVVGMDEAEHEQWRNVWPTIKDFRIRLDEIHAFVSPDRLLAVAITFFDSTGFQADGTPFPRTGRVTVSFTRTDVGGPWLANHSHMSLAKGTPSLSHGAGT